MTHLVFALQFRGHGAPVPGREDLRRGRTAAPSQGFRTVLTATGVEAGVEPLRGETATLEAEVHLQGDGRFVESGRIRYGVFGAVTFRTVGHGVRGPSGLPGLVTGVVLWEVTGGEGGLAGARGYITSSFSVTDAGEVVDTQVAQLVLPG